MPAKLLIRCVTIIHLLFLLAWTAVGILLYIRDHYGPTLSFPYEMNKDVMLPFCGPSTETFEDLIVHENQPTSQATKQTERHGAAVVRNVLSKDTARELREFILRENHRVESAHVMSNEHRYHVMPDHSHPTIQQAFQEIASHMVLRPLIDSLLGPRSSLVAFSAITNEYGAENQEWHYDTATSHANYPRYFVPEYTLAIPLQDTTEGMGPTGICPGTSKCSWPDFDYSKLEEYFEQNVETDEWDGFDQWLRNNLPCPMTVAVDAGDAMLYNADVFHRGTAHTDPSAPERVVVFLTFAGSRQGPNDHRSLPFGTVHSLNWKTWGHTIDEFLTIKEKPWRPWHALGLYSSKADGVRPWTIPDNFLMIFRASIECCHMISNDFDAEHFSLLVQKIVWTTVAVTVWYFWTSIIAALVYCRWRDRKNHLATAKFKESFSSSHRTTIRMQQKLQ
jgi:ectoine hydroxylase-related dioxygenase (phytanoyl-CoA dioxygenase family)